MRTMEKIKTENKEHIILVLPARGIPVVEETPFAAMVSPNPTGICAISRKCATTAV